MLDPLRIELRALRVAAKIDELTRLRVLNQKTATKSSFSGENNISINNNLKTMSKAEMIAAVTTTGTASQ